MTILTQQQTSDYDRPAQELTEAILRVDDKKREELIEAIRDFLPQSPTVSDRWRVAGQGGGSPSSNIEREYGGMYETFLSDVALISNLTADELRHQAYTAQDTSAASIMGVVKKIQGLGREHIQLALNKLRMAG